MKDIYQAVTDQVIGALEAGTPPWVCPWTCSAGTTLPANAASSRPYRGINVLLLQMQAVVRGYDSNRWLTFNQARALSAHVRRGEEGTGIVFFKMREVDGVAPLPAASNDAPGKRVIPLLRSFTVFNVCQVEDLPPALTVLPAPPAEWTPIGEADAVLQRSGANIRHGGDRAFYRPSDDTIQLPPQAQFPDAGHYYNVALHELTHSTAHPDRCNRQLASRAHVTAYAFEELVAEMGSAFLSSYCGLVGELQHASYIASWLEALRKDKRLIFTAASLAQKAADYLIEDAGALPGSAQAVSAVAVQEAA